MKNVVSVSIMSCHVTHHVMSIARIVSIGACRVMVSGPGPSARYAHTLALVANR